MRKFTQTYRHYRRGYPRAFGFVNYVGLTPMTSANYQIGHTHGYISVCIVGNWAISKIQYDNDENF